MKKIICITIASMVILIMACNNPEKDVKRILLKVHGK